MIDGATGVGALNANAVPSVAPGKVCAAAGLANGSTARRCSAFAIALQLRFDYGAAGSSERPLI
jgi:hypothetical protein